MHDGSFRPVPDLLLDLILVAVSSKKAMPSANSFEFPPVVIWLCLGVLIVVLSSSWSGLSLQPSIGFNGRASFNLEATLVTGLSYFVFDCDVLFKHDC